MIVAAPGTPWLAERVLAAHAAATPDAPALLHDDGVVTWAGLDGRSSAVAEMVAGAGVGPGERVALLVDAVVDAIPAILGTLRAGAVACPIPAGLTDRERTAAVGALKPALVLRVAELAGRRPIGLIPIVEEPDPEAPAVIILTSGTTGRPKGVVLSHRALAASADAWRAALPKATGWALPLGVAHVAGLGIVWRALADRVPVSIVAPGDPAALLAAVRERPGPSHVSLVPSQLRRVLDASGDAPPPPSLLAVPLGGGAMSAGLVLRALRAGWPVVPTYGLSEMGSGVTALPTAEAATAPGTAGRTLAGVSLAIVDPDAEGVGEITVSGPSRCSGYLGEPPVALDEPLHTGDLGRMDEEGRLIVIDRRTDRIVRGGENIAPAEVERVLETHPDVAEAAVVGRPDDAWGQVPVAALVLRGGHADPGDEALVEHARESLAGFKVPEAFVRLDVLPRTTGGKLRREAVRALLAGERAGELARPWGEAIGWRVTGDGPTSVLLLHGTLSSAAQLDRLAAALAAPGDLTVHAIDRRGSGTSRIIRPRPIEVQVHVEDLVAYLDARGIDRAIAIGISFGGVIALELAARQPERVIAVAAYEPPYGVLAEGEWHDWFTKVADDTAAAHARAGAPAAAQVFLRAVAGDAAWDRLPARAQGYLAREGDGALADVVQTGLDPDGLRAIAAPAAILTGSASEPFYAPIAEALAARIPGSRRQVLPGATHTTPITAPAPVVAAIRTLLEFPA
jgi:o-succinylbenzoate---CoA ligase